MPPWHVGHVIQKLMGATAKRMKRDELATKAGVQPMTITNLLRRGRPDQDTLEKVAKVFGCTADDIRHEADRSNQRSVPLPIADQRRRATDRDPVEVEAEQYARRLVRLSDSAQTAIFNTIRAFEAAFGFLNRRE